MRQYIEILNEKGFARKELSMVDPRYSGKYLVPLIQLATTSPVKIVPAGHAKYGETVHLAPETIKALAAAAKDQSTNSDNLIPEEPIFVLDNGKKVTGTWAAIDKSGQFTKLPAGNNQVVPDGESESYDEAKKKYNAGHLAELFMAMAVSSKFFNLGEPITVQNVLDFFGNCSVGGHVNPKTNKPTTNLKFTLTKSIQYPKGKQDELNFISVNPGASASEFVRQYKENQLAPDLAAVLASSVKYVNQSQSVTKSVKRVREDPSHNVINVVSDGTSDSKGTKADLILSIDGKKVNLLSLKTYSTKTFGQNSGTTFEALNLFIEKGFGINLDKYKSHFDPSLTKMQLVNNILKLYDDVIYPQVEKLVTNQKAGKEAKIIRDLANAALYHVRGEKLEDVEVVKLDDSIAEGNYKILKFSDDLHEAMQHLKLYSRIIGEGRGRTIQLLVKPAETLKRNDITANLLCQFRSQMMGSELRNYFEIGDVMVELTELPQTTNEARTRVPELRETYSKNLGRARR